MSELKNFYQSKVKKELKEAFGYKSDFEIPKVEKVVVNVGVGEAVGSPQVLEKVEEQISTICGQKPRLIKSKKNISTFKLRKGMVVGISATLRGARMYDFLKKFLSIVLPRIRDFRGVPNSSFDGRGNYTIGIKEQIIFPEISHEKQEIIHGMSITIVTTAKDTHEGRILLEALGFPFKK